MVKILLYRFSQHVDTTSGGASQANASLPLSVATTTHGTAGTTVMSWTAVRPWFSCCLCLCLCPHLSLCVCLSVCVCHCLTLSLFLSLSLCHFLPLCDPLFLCICICFLVSWSVFATVSLCFSLCPSVTFSLSVSCSFSVSVSVCNSLSCYSHVFSVFLFSSWLIVFSLHSCGLGFDVSGIASPSPPHFASLIESLHHHPSTFQLKSAAYTPLALKF